MGSVQISLSDNTHLCFLFLNTLRRCCIYLQAAYRMLCADTSPAAMVYTLLLVHRSVCDFILHVNTRGILYCCCYVSVGHGRRWCHWRISTTDRWEQPIGGYMNARNSVLGKTGSHDTQVSHDAGARRLTASCTCWGLAFSTSWVGKGCKTKTLSNFFVQIPFDGFFVGGRETTKLIVQFGLWYVAGS